MKVTYKWLKEFVDFDFSSEDLCEKLTMLGLEVDDYQTAHWNFDGVEVGEVVNKEQHPGSDKLWVCRVLVGSRDLTMVCGAPNVAIGQKVPVVCAESSLPDGKVIKIAQIRGVESQGMICSELELGISSRGDGIMVLDDDVEHGEKLATVLGNGDTVIDIDVTPNRPDCFGVMGVAREVGAVAGSSLRKPQAGLQESDPPIQDLITIAVEDPEKCPRYTARFIGGVEIGDSPWWLAQRLESVGIRSINNVVDVTNYVMMETGQPLHAFDYDLLGGHEIKVRTAEEGTAFRTLDDKAHTLSSETLMICDREREIAIAGIMGGANSEVSSATKNILLESAYFDPVNVRRTAKKLGMSTESSRRFERGTDPNGVLYALDRAAEMIAKLARGRIARGTVDVYPTSIVPKVVRLRTARVAALLGIQVSPGEIKGILSRLEFKVGGGKGPEMELEVPTFRPDIKQEADLIEEVARVYGFDKIPADFAATIQQSAQTDAFEAFSASATRTLICSGLSRVVTYSILSKRRAELFSRNGALAQLINPVGEDFSTLRPSLVPGLLGVVHWNLNRGNRDLRIFEIGNIFKKSGKKVEEELSLAAVLTGGIDENSWKRRADDLDLYDVRGFLEILLKRNRMRRWEFGVSSGDVTDNHTLDIYIDNQKIGRLGGIRKEVLKEFDIEQPVYMFDLDFTMLFNNTDRLKTFQPIPKFPAVKRDIAVTVRESTDSGNLIDEIRLNGGEFLRSVNLFDVFAGKQVASGNKSMAFSLTFYSLEKTLKEEEVDTQMQVILDALATKFSARLRD